MDMFDLAGMLFGNRRDSVAQGSTLTATGSAASEDGTAYLVMDADVTPAEGVGDDTDQTVIDVPTSPSVAEGDEVIMTLVGDGPLKTPIVTANPGSGDRMAAAVQEAAGEVEQVRQDVADFRDDVATTYATKVERQDGDDAVKTWVTTNYTNSNDLATTYATKTLVSQTKDAIELAASQTYETQSDAAATYATKSALTVGLDGIRSEVAEDYQPKGDYATTASMNSAIQQSASSIESSVAATYETKSDASATYATKTEVQQTASGLDTRITTAQSTADGAYLERTATGTTIDTTGAATIRSLVVEGKSVQDGTPTPSAPVPIVSVESRNLLNFDAWRSVLVTNGTAQWGNGTVMLTATAGDCYTLFQSDGTFPAAAYIPVTAGEVVTLSWDADSDNHGRVYLFGNGDVNIRAQVDNAVTKSLTYTVPNGVTFLTFRFGVMNNGKSITYSNIQLERGTTANPYQPYGCVTLVAGSTRTDIDLQGHALRSLPDGTHDEMAVDSLGRVTMTQRVGVLTLDGSETWTAENGGARVVASLSPTGIGPASNAQVANLLCDHFVASSPNGTWVGASAGMDISTSGQGIHVSDGTRAMTANGFKTWLAANPTEVLYALATPVTHDLGTIDLPTPADTLWLDAAIVPTIEATWWTVGGIAGQQALDAEVTERQTLIRQFSGGVLAGYVGNAIAALVNAAGSFDVVRTAWTDGVPSILGTLARYAASGISLFDAAGNVLAEFASDHVRIGGAIPEDGSAVATVCFFDSDADKGAMLTGYVDQSGDATQQTQDTRTQLRTRTHDADMPTTYGAAGESGLDVGQWLHAETGSYSTVESTATLTATADSGTDPTQTAHASASLGVKAVTVNDSAEEAYLTVNGNDVPMEQAIAAFPVTLYDDPSASASAAATLSETAANFSRLTIFFKDNDGTHGSVDVWSPDGKRVALPITWISGASTQQMYQRVRWVTISGTSISTYKASGDAKYRTGQVRLGGTYSVTNGDYISIVHVIGWR